MNANELAPFGYTKSGRIRKTALKPKIALYGYTKSGRIRVNPLKSQTHNVCEDCGIKFDNEGWLTLKYCECCDDQRRSNEEEDKVWNPDKIKIKDHDMGLCNCCNSWQPICKFLEDDKILQPCKSCYYEPDDRETDVDDRDAPNILPYKKCGFCNERSSCGNYTDDNVWKCEGCTPDQEDYLSELIECVKCERDVRRVDLAWTKTGGSYLDVCEDCGDKK